jgi:hypothetical protein
MYPPSLATRVIIQGCVKCGCAKHGGRYCPINPNILKCVYCGFRQHFVHSCQILQSACPICWYRGHGNDPKCPGNRDVQKDFLRFERYADFGEKSRLRTEQGCWGYGFWWTPIDLGYRNYQSMRDRAMATAEGARGILQEIQTSVEFATMSWGQRQDAQRQVSRVLPPRVRGRTYGPSDHAQADWAGMMAHHTFRHRNDPEPPNDDDERPPPPPPQPPAQQYVRTYKAGGWWTELLKLRELQDNVLGQTHKSSSLCRVLALTELSIYLLYVHA